MYLYVNYKNIDKFITRAKFCICIHPYIEKINCDIVGVKLFMGFRSCIQH